MRLYECFDFKGCSSRLSNTICQVQLARNEKRTGKHYTIQLGGTRMRARHRLNPAQAIQRCNVNDPN